MSLFRLLAWECEGIDFDVFPVGGFVRAFLPLSESSGLFICLVIVEDLGTERKI